MEFLDIVFFQSGNFHNSGNQETVLSIFLKFAPILLTGLISTGLALWIFYKGKKKEEDREAERLTDVRELFFISTVKFKAGLKVQIEAIKKVKEKNTNDIQVASLSSKLRTPMKCVDAFPLQIIDINKNDVFKFMVQNHQDNKTERMNSFSSFYSTIKVVEVILNDLYKFGEELNDEFIVLHNRIEDSKKELYRLINLYVHNLYLSDTKGKLTDPFYLKIDKIFTDFQLLKDPSIDTSFKKLASPIEEVCHESKDHPDSKEFINHCFDLRNSFDQMIDKKRNQNSNYDIWIKGLENSLDVTNGLIEIELKDLIEKLKKISGING
jgi:hypothetical protein